MRALFAAVWMLIAVMPRTAQAEPTELELAYQREFAYLEAEKAALDNRLSSLGREVDRRAASGEAEIGTLQSRLLALRARRTRSEVALSAAMRDADGITEAQDAIDSTLFQADAGLPAFTVPEADGIDAQAKALRLAYEEGARMAGEASTVGVSEGSWFLPSGERVEGQLVRVGRIATFGVADQAGALIPVGEGKLQLRNTEASATARALASGGRPQPLGLFAYEDTGKRIDEAAPKTWMTTLKAGGIVGLVVLVLGAIGVLLAALRAVGLASAGRGSRAVHTALEQLEQGQWDAALATVRRAPGAGARVLAAMLPVGPDRSRLEDRAAEALLTETPHIERFAAAILVIAAVAPLLGLLGTVTGMIGTFEIITEFGTGDPGMLSGGISEALVTTQLGLIVAIPMLLIGNLLNRYAETTLTRVEAAAVGVVNRVEPIHSADASPRMAVGG